MRRDIVLLAEMIWSIDLDVLHTTATDQLPAFVAALRTVLNNLTEGT
jgi:hypothetical protein